MAVLMPLAEAADRLGIPPETLRRYVRSGRIQCRRPGGPDGNILFTQADLDAFLESCLIPSRTGVAGRGPDAA